MFDTDPAVMVPVFVPTASSLAPHPLGCVIQLGRACKPHLSTHPGATTDREPCRQNPWRPLSAKLHKSYSLVFLCHTNYLFEPWRMQLHLAMLVRSLCPGSLRENARVCAHGCISRLVVLFMWPYACPSPCAPDPPLSSLPGPGGVHWAVWAQGAPRRPLQWQPCHLQVECPWMQAGPHPACMQSTQNRVRKGRGSHTALC